jgi:predicted kinase
MTSQKLIVLSGLPGSGKSTLADGLSRILSMPVFSVDPIKAAMWRGGLAKAQTGIAAYGVAITLADEYLRLGHSVVVDAVNPVEAPRAAWRNLAAKYRADLRIIKCVCADERLTAAASRRGFAVSTACPRSPGLGCRNGAPNMRHGPTRTSLWILRRKRQSGGLPRR